VPLPLLTDTSAALVVGGIGLIGVVVGAGIGLFGTLITTSRQIDRQERNARRVVYAGYLKSAIRATDLLTDQRRAFEEANSTADAYYHFLDEARDPANARSVDYIRLQVDKQWTQSQDARDRLGSLLDEFRPVWRDLTVAGHELKIHAPQSVYEAAMHIYSSVGVATAYDRPADPDLWNAQGRALRCFSALARSDSRSPDAPRLRRAQRRQRAELQALDHECRRLEQVMHEQVVPEMLRPLLTDEELEAP